MSGFVTIPGMNVPKLEQLAEETRTRPEEFVAQSANVSLRVGGFTVQARDRGFRETPELVIHKSSGQTLIAPVEFKDAPRIPSIAESLKLSEAEGFSLYLLDEELAEDISRLSKALGINAITLLRPGMVWRRMLDPLLRDDGQFASMTAGPHVEVPIDDVAEFVGCEPPHTKLPEYYYDAVRLDQKAAGFGG